MNRVRKIALIWVISLLSCSLLSGAAFADVFSLANGPVVVEAASGDVEITGAYTGTQADTAITVSIGYSGKITLNNVSVDGTGNHYQIIKPMVVGEWNGANTPTNLEIVLVGDNKLIASEKGGHGIEAGYAYAPLTISGTGKLFAQSWKGGNGIVAAYGLTITATGNIEVRGGRGSSSTGCAGIYVSQGTLETGSGSLVAIGGGMDPRDESEYTGSEGIWARDMVTGPGPVVAKAGEAGYSIGNGLNVSKNLTIGGPLEAVGPSSRRGNGGHGIYAESITIATSSLIKATGGNTGPDTTNGTGGHGIFVQTNFDTANANIVANGGNGKGTGASGHGIFCSAYSTSGGQFLTIGNGSIEAYGGGADKDGDGISAGNIAIGGGRVKALGGLGTTSNGLDINATVGKITITGGSVDAGEAYVSSPPVDGNDDPVIKNTYAGTARQAVVLNLSNGALYPLIIPADGAAYPWFPAGISVNDDSSLTLAAAPAAGKVTLIATPAGIASFADLFWEYAMSESGPYTALASAAGAFTDAQTYAHTSLRAGATYYYRAKVTIAGVETYTDVISATVPGSTPGGPPIGGGGSTEQPSTVTTPTGIFATIGNERIEAERQTDGTYLVTLPALSTRTATRRRSARSRRRARAYASPSRPRTPRPWMAVR